MFVDIVKICDELVLNGYNDWCFPTSEDCKILEINLINHGIGNIYKDVSLGVRNGRYYHRPVRTF
jgi:hypothetical protein